MGIMKRRYSKKDSKKDSKKVQFKDVLEESPKHISKMENKRKKWESFFWNTTQLVSCVAIFSYIGWNAYQIRLHAINTYGKVIHEFDPWFNFRATQYLADNGFKKFFSWFDHESWYPLGRPVGTTIYPGMQITSVAIWNTLNYLGYSISLNDVCVYAPVWFGVLATFFLGMLTYECSKSKMAGLSAAAVMSIIPAHLMRSVGGGYDNESMAVTAMCMTFYCWCRSLRTDQSWPVGIFTGLSYIYMAAMWGGYIFVLNLIGLHAASLTLTGRHSTKLHRAYSLFYLIGTAGAMQIPVINWTPLKSLEQLGGMAVFLGLQMYELSEVISKKHRLNFKDSLKVKLKVFGIGAILLMGVITALIPTGYFGPLSSRVRGLFVQHTRTGNPLVDSVAEHQPASPSAYYHYLYYMCTLAPIGFLSTFIQRSDAKFFLTVYGVVAYYFSAKMSRLILLLGPISSSLGGLVLGMGLNYAFKQFWDSESYFKNKTEKLKDKKEFFDFQIEKD